MLIHLERGMLLSLSQRQFRAGGRLGSLPYCGLPARIGAAFSATFY
jgi:hypothetical protein